MIDLNITSAEFDLFYQHTMYLCKRANKKKSSSEVISNEYDKSHVITFSSVTRKGVQKSIASVSPSSSFCIECEIPVPPCDLEQPLSIDADKLHRILKSIDWRPQSQFTMEYIAQGQTFSDVYGENQAEHDTVLVSVGVEANYPLEMQIKDFSNAVDYSAQMNITGGSAINLKELVRVGKFCASYSNKESTYLELNGSLCIGRGLSSVGLSTMSGSDNDYKLALNQDVYNAVGWMPEKPSSATLFVNDDFMLIDAGTVRILSSNDETARGLSIKEKNGEKVKISSSHINLSEGQVMPGFEVQAEPFIEALSKAAIVARDDKQPVVLKYNDGCLQVLTESNMTKKPCTFDIGEIFLTDHPESSSYISFFRDGLRVNVTDLRTMLASFSSYECILITPRLFHPDVFEDPRWICFSAQCQSTNIRNVSLLAILR